MGLQSKVTSRKSHIGEHDPRAHALNHGTALCPVVPSHSPVVLRYLHKHWRSLAGSLTTALHPERAVFHHNHQKHALSTHQRVQRMRGQKNGSRRLQQESFPWRVSLSVFLSLCGICQGIVTPFRFSPSSYSLTHRHQWAWILNLRFPAA